MKNIEDAIKLSNTMRDIGSLADRKTICVLTNMDEPVGYHIGNSLEIVEAVECLKGNMPEDIKEIVMTLGAYLIKLAGEGENIEENKKRIIETISNGMAYNKFLELVEAQRRRCRIYKKSEKV